MLVNGPLEIYAVVIGVKMFDSFFNVLASMGIFFIPLLVIFTQNTTAPYESEIENGANTSLKRTAIQLLCWVLTMMFCVVPVYTLDVREINYKPVCHDNAAVSRFGDTGTTYDDVFADFHYETLRLPLMMNFFVTSFSGLTNVMISSLPCKTDVQQMKGTIDTVRLTPDLADQVMRFREACYAPAITSFRQQDPDENQYAGILKNYGGQSDLSWVGSHVLQSLYYQDLYAQKPVHGFLFSQYKGPYGEYNQKHGVRYGKWGYPNCNTWWSDPDHGIRSRLVALAQKHSPNNAHLGELPLKDRVSSWMHSVENKLHVGSSITPDDVIARSMLYDPKSYAGYNYMDISSYNYTDMESSSGNVSNYAATAAALAGQGISAAEGAVARAEVSQEIPVLQAVLMAIALMLGPLIMALAMITGGGAGIGIVFTYYFMIASINFITFIEKFLHYLEVSLRASESGTFVTLGFEHLVMANVFTKLYFFAPMIYLGIMSICGIALGSSISKGFDNPVSGGPGGKGVVESIGKKVLGFVK